MLIQPTVDLQASYVAYIDELKNEERYPYPLDLPHADFSSLISLLTDYSLGKNLPSGLVPNTTYWLVEDNEIVGCSHLRHKLNTELAHSGGHIGLGIRPSFRGRGFGKILLNQTLAKAREKQLKAVHIHCYSDNEASKRLIENVGAVLDLELHKEDSDQKILRYIYTNDSIVK